MSSHTLWLKNQSHTWLLWLYVMEYIHNSDSIIIKNNNDYKWHLLYTHDTFNNEKTRDENKIISVID